MRVNGIPPSSAPGSDPRSARAGRHGPWMLIGALALFAALVLASLPRSARGNLPAQAQLKKVIVLGIDGVDPNLLEEWMHAGRLPNLQRLRKGGTYMPLGTSMPPQSPVAWSNFITGKNSGGHGIFDFIHRDPQTYFPYSSMSEVLPAEDQISFLGLKLPNIIRLPGSDYMIPLAGGTTENLRKGTPFWSYLGQQNIPAVIHRVPVNFPPVGDGAITLSGMGTPDIQGSSGTYAYYTDAPPPNYESATGGKIFITDVINGVAKGKLYGPPNDFIDYDNIQAKTGRSVPYQERKASIPFTVYVDEDNPVARLEIDGQEVFLKEGEFSHWIEVTFSLLPTPGFIRWLWHDLVSVKGLVRCYLKSTHPDFGLYISPVQISPLHPALPISTPPEYASELAEAIGCYYTQGMPEDTKALEMDVFANADFMKQAAIIADEEIRMAHYELDRFEEGFIFLYFSVIDQVGHVMWRTMEGQEEHPAYVAELDDPFKDVYVELYEHLDRVVGTALDYVDAETCFIVMSDHGFSSWTRSFDLNRWLFDNGYLSVKPGVAPSSVQYLQGVDWQNTTAYGLGINGLYINQLGREKHGVVPPGPAKQRLLHEIAEKLEAVVDPVTGRQPITKVFTRDEIYSGEYVDIGPDAQIGYDVGYRASDECAVGEITDTVLSNNTRRWSGDHCQDYRKVPGILLTNRPVKLSDPSLIDLAPSILTLLGIDPPSDMEGRPIF